MNTICNIHKQIDKIIETNFTKLCRLEGFVIDTDSQSKFVISSIDKKYTIECRSFDRIDHIKYGDCVIIDGTIRLYKDQPCKMYINVDNVRTKDECESQRDNASTYRKLRRSLTGEYKKNIDKIHNRVVPQCIYNIGLIVPPNNSTVGAFKVCFNELCRANLYVFNLNSNSNVINAIEFFRKYHNIDVICVLVNHINFQDCMELSSEKIAKYILNTEHPYMVSVCQAENVVPIICTLSNLVVKTAYDFARFINSNQTELRIKRSQMKKLCDDNIQRLICYQKERIMQYKLLFAETDEYLIRRKIAKTKMLALLAMEKMRSHIQSTYANYLDSLITDSDGNKKIENNLSNKNDTDSKSIKELTYES